MAGRILSPAVHLLKTVSIAPTLARASSNGIGYKQAIANFPATNLSVLDNNMRVASEEMSGPLASVGVFIDGGSRYETPGTNGVGKFLERMSFKGTSSLSGVALEQEVAAMGATIESFTGREQSGFVGHCLKKDVPKMVELLSDIVQNSSLEQAEVERQRAAIIKSLAEPLSMEEVVLNHVHANAFQGTPLGQSPDGTSENVKLLTREDLLSYRNNTYCAPRIVLAGAGEIDHQSLTDLAQKHFNKLRGDDSSPGMPTYCRYTGSELRMRDDDMPQAHIGLFLKGCGYDDPDHLVLQLAATLLGQWNSTMGDGLNTSFSLARACTVGKLGSAYRTHNICYKDTGLFGIYLVSNKLSIEVYMYNLYAELMRFCETVTDFDIERAKNILRNQVMLEASHPSTLCKQIGKQTLGLNRKIPLSELDGMIAEIDGAHFREVCTKYIYDKCPVVVGVGPIEQLFHYLSIRSNLYWLRV